ncbi:hypothetical protein [Pseudaestuariivita rosea]|uniref:hypothetical protein n=1 Tax=Pseudaestuariivita rosea TaxID=2763263 RepID=UPI001ABBBF61|nr:hypothetical protein [Pseudaestuariivita rosea]
MRFWSILMSVAVAGFASIASAQQNDVQRHIQAWLSGEDENSLAALAQAAAGGNTTAQILLGQIDRDTVPGGFSPYLLSLGNDARDSLLRRNGTDGTENWLLDLSNPDPADYGMRLFGYRVGRTPIRNAVALREVDETVAAEFVLWTTLNDGRFDLVNAMPAENYGLGQAGFLLWLRGYIEGSNKVMTMDRLSQDSNPAKLPGLLALDKMSRLLNLGQFISDDVKVLITVLKGQRYALPDDANVIMIRNALNDMAQVDAPLGMLATLCGNCENGTVDPECMSQSLEIIGGYKTLMSVRTPAESVIPAGTFYSSQRAQITLEQLIKSRSEYYAPEIESSCIAGFIE